MIDHRHESARIADKVAADGRPGIHQVGPLRAGRGVEHRRREVAVECIGGLDDGHREIGILRDLHHRRGRTLIDRIEHGQRVRAGLIDNGRQGALPTDDIPVHRRPGIRKIRYLPAGIGLQLNTGDRTVQFVALSGVHQGQIGILHDCSLSRGKTTVESIEHLQGIGSGGIDFKQQTVGAVEDVPVGRDPGIDEIRTARRGACVDRHNRIGATHQHRWQDGSAGGGHVFDHEYGICTRTSVSGIEHL